MTSQTPSVTDALERLAALRDHEANLVNLAQMIGSVTPLSPTSNAMAKAINGLPAVRAAIAAAPREACHPRPFRSPEELARFFHETYERLAPTVGYQTREASAKPWSDVPEVNRTLMCAVAQEVLRVWPSPAPTVAVLRQTIGFLRSVIRSGERLTAEDDARIDESLRALKTEL